MQKVKLNYHYVASSFFLKADLQEDKRTGGSYKNKQIREKN